MNLKIMSRKPTKGYFVRGKFVAEGSELDMELQRELRGGLDPDKTKTELKVASTELQELGEALIGLRSELRKKLDVSDLLKDAIDEFNRITNFEGKRRQGQFIGKLMRRLDATQIQSIRDALEQQRTGNSTENAALHAAEIWRERLLVEDEAVTAWLSEFPETDIQQLRSLVRQARKDRAAIVAAAASAAEAAAATGEAVVKPAARPSRAYKDLFQMLREQMRAAAGEQADDADDEDQE